MKGAFVVVVPSVVRSLVVLASAVLVVFLLRGLVAFSCAFFFFVFSLLCT
jgi:hypothetical protein